MKTYAVRVDDTEAVSRWYKEEWYLDDKQYTEAGFNAEIARRQAERVANERRATIKPNITESTITIDGTKYRLIEED